MGLFFSFFSSPYLFDFFDLFVRSGLPVEAAFAAFYF